jgi:hypothetical protein
MATRVSIRLYNSGKHGWRFDLIDNATKKIRSLRTNDDGCGLWLCDANPMLNPHTFESTFVWLQVAGLDIYFPPNRASAYKKIRRMLARPGFILFSN